MSTCLYYKPVVIKSYPSLSDELKNVLSKKYDLYNRNLYLSQKDINFLEGLLVCDIDGTQELIDAIIKHDEVELWISHS